MQHKTLYEVIKYLQYGTNLHIGVLFFNNFGNEMCVLPKKHETHSRDVCEIFKGMEKKGFKLVEFYHDLAQIIRVLVFKR